jgi:hypothetical protein
MWQFVVDVAKTIPASSQSAEQLVRIIAGNSYVAGLLPFSATAELRETLRERVFTSPTRPPEAFYRSMSLGGLIALVELGESASLFPSAQEKELVSAVLVEKLDRTYPEALRARLCQKILLKK